MISFGVKILKYGSFKMYLFKLHMPFLHVENLIKQETM